MLIGVPKELKTEEYRVGLTPNSVKELTGRGHGVVVERDCGLGIHFDNNAYMAAGAVIADSIDEVYKRAELIVKVKEPQKAEYPLLRSNQILLTYLHLAPDLKQTQALLKSDCIAIAYETVTSATGGLPLLTPMSQVAGRLAVQVGAHCLEKPQGGSGVLLGGVPGVYSGKVTVIGGGVVGSNAVSMAIGKKARVSVLDTSLRRLQELDAQFSGSLNTAYATDAVIEQYVADSDLVIGAVLLPGGSAPKLVRRAFLKNMRPGSVMVDVAIDQGGCFETSHPTTHKNPTYRVDGVLHYCVTNMPGAVPYTSTLALNNATLPVVVALADKGYKQACLDDSGLLNGLNIYKGQVVYEAVARDLNMRYVPAMDALAGK